MASNLFEWDFTFFLQFYPAGTGNLTFSMSAACFMRTPEFEGMREKFSFRQIEKFIEKEARSFFMDLYKEMIRLASLFLWILHLSFRKGNTCNLFAELQKFLL